jgi:hypothetical protein
VFDGDTEILCLYRHCDGYPGGHGADLLAVTKDRRIVNGYSSRSTLRRANMMNGAGHMATAIVREIDNLSIYPVGTKDCWEEYEYHVKCPNLVPKPGEDLDSPPDGVPITLVCFLVSGDTEKGTRKLSRRAIPGAAKLAKQAGLTGSPTRE